VVEAKEGDLTMPRSQNRRTIEVPVSLYEELKARAAAEGTTIPAVLQALITDGKSVEEWYGEMVGLLRAVHQDVRVLRDRSEAGLRPAAADPVPGGL
jgi:hypothetical protein